MAFSSVFDFAPAEWLPLQDRELVDRMGQMQIPDDIERALAVCKEEGNEDVILLKCVSSYPTPYE